MFEANGVPAPMFEDVPAPKVEDNGVPTPRVEDNGVPVEGVEGALPEAEPVLRVFCFFAAWAMQDSSLMATAF